jgi:SNF2 family DNA or RNA helicase
VGLTGTPLTNRPRDLWNVVDTLTPGRFGNFFLFAKRYCGAFQEQVTPEKLVWNFEGKSNTEELNRRLQHFMLRRTVEEVKMQLPQKTRQIIELDVSKKYRMSYGANDLRDTRLVRQMLDVAADGKIDEALNLVMDHARAGHHVVAFSHRRVIAETIASTAAAQGLKAEIVYGGVPNQRRKERIDSRPDILACTIDSCSTGIDLTSFDVAVVIELVYKPHELVQMEARLHRFGQQRPVLIQYIIAQGTIDELIAGSVIAKIDTFKEVIGKVGGAGELSRDLDSRGKNDPLANLVKAFEASRKGKGK